LKTGIAELGSREYRFTSLSKMSKADVATRRTDISFAAGSGIALTDPRLRRVPEWQPALIPPVVAG
jgi:hypothetical protein